MKSKTTIALAIATALIVPAAMADEATTQPPKSKCVPPVGENCPSAKKQTAAPKKEEAAVEPPAEPETPATPESTSEPPMPPPQATGGGPAEQEPVPPPPPVVMTAPPDTYAAPAQKEEHNHRVRRGFGIGGFGSFGAREDARWGVGGRIEYVMRYGLAFGASYTVNWESGGDRTQVRPLLGEVGWSFAVARNFEVRPMVGIGWAFVNRERTTYTNDQGQTVSTKSIVGDGFDIAPGAKISYLASILEIYTAPKYHFIQGNNFFGVEVGAGARF